MSIPRPVKIGGLILLGCFVLVAFALPFTLGIRPIVGAQARSLTERRFEATPVRLERGRYLVTSVARSGKGSVTTGARSFP
jgi:hypothetical protein